ncbi:MAG: hypothetical protein HRT99_03390 [Mycoplasmatales bacterium]|nr:hypothetical protein [Mycoplasmatales bacterium]
MMDFVNYVLYPILASLISASFIFLAGWSFFRRNNKFNQIDKTNFKKDIEDLIGRDKVANSIYKTIINLNKKNHSRFSIEGKYGYGKTFISNLIQEKIEKDNNIIISFAAWEKDEYYSPVERLLISIYNEESKLLEKKDKKDIKQLLKKDSRLSRLPFETYIKKYDILKSLDKKMTKKLNGKKVFLIIDELDRATNNDSIELLEITNQIFGTNNDIITIYLYNFEQLKKIIEHNTGINDEKYINKFIDFRFNLRNNSYEYLIKMLDSKYRDIIEQSKKSIKCSLREVDLFVKRIEYYKTKIKNDDFLIDWIILEDYIRNILNDNENLHIQLKEYLKILQKDAFDKFELVDLNLLDCFNILESKSWNKNLYNLVIEEFHNSDVKIKISFLIKEIDLSGLRKQIAVSNLNWVIKNILKCDLKIGNYKVSYKGNVSEYRKIILSESEINIWKNFHYNNTDEIIDDLKNGIWNDRKISEDYKTFHEFVKKIR